MHRFYFNCELLENVVLPTRWASTLSLDTLAYLPGNLFRGVFASIAHNQSKKIGGTDNFYNGYLRFGDGHLLINNQRSLPQPATWFYLKGKSIQQALNDEATNGILLGDTFTTESYKEFGAKNWQPKQTRTGYFSIDRTHKKVYTQTVQSSLTLKTAYDPKHRSSKNEQLFAYYYLKAGQTFQFFIESADLSLLNSFQHYFNNKKVRLGRSKNAEFGLANTTFSHQEIIATQAATKEVYLFCETPLCLVDAYGTYVSKIDPQRDFNLAGKVNLPKSKILTNKITLWNGRRQTWDRERLVIQKGSVIVLDVAEAAVGQAIQHSFGVHRAEGFGNVIVNPDFLTTTILAYQVEKIKPNTAATATTTSDNPLLQYLAHKDQMVQSELTILKEVAAFKKRYAKRMQAKISASQWGMVYQQALQANSWSVLDSLLFNTNRGALYTGQAKTVWVESNCSIWLKTGIKEMPEDLRVPFTLKLSREMAKTAK